MMDPGALHNTNIISFRRSGRRDNDRNGSASYNRNWHQGYQGYRNPEYHEFRASGLKRDLDIRQFNRRREFYRAREETSDRTRNYLRRNDDR